jgi:serine phosphatase RsbU (regulator of sigma subunit)
MSENESSITAADWPQASQFKKSIRYEFARYISVILLLLMAATGYVISSRYVREVTRSVVEKLLVQARSYSGPAGKLIISSGGPDALLLNNLCKKLVKDNPDVYWAGITDGDLVFIAHTDIRQVIGANRMHPVAAGQFQHVLRPNEGFAVRSDTVYISVSIDEGEIALGSLAVAASALPIKAARSRSIVTVGTITLVMIGIGIPVAVTVLRRKLRPISIITDHLKAVNLHDISINIPVKSENEFGFLAETLRVMGSKLSIAQRELIDKERMTRELEIAREIQANILPRDYPKGPEFELAGAYLSAREVGGDYYDFIEFREDLLGILIADVSGKSLPGMLVMLLTRDIVRKLARQEKEPAKLLSAVNADLMANIKKGMFVTMFFGILDKARGTFSFASAGHNPLIVVRHETGKAEAIKTKGFPLGMVDTDAYEKRIESGLIELSANDRLVLYTDGVNEAQSLAGEEFGLGRFIRIIEKNPDSNAEELVGEVLRQQGLFVGDAPQYDDITLLAIKWLGQHADTRDIATMGAGHVG